MKISKRQQAAKLRSAVGSLLLVLSLPADAQSSTSADKPSANELHPKPVRKFEVPGLSPDIAYAELLQFDRPTTAADTVDAVAEFKDQFGKTTGMSFIPIDGIRGSATLFKFAGGKGVLAMVEDNTAVKGSSGRHACRIVMDSSAGKPPPDLFLVLNRWCMHALALANLDASVFDRSGQ